MKNLLFVIILLPFMAAAQWMPDVLGPGFEMRYVDQGTDYSGPVRCTVVRHLSPCSMGSGVLYVHGYNDYFFQSEMADVFVDSCYSFYAVDLRKYGRSIMPGQRKFEVRDISEYYADIDSALSIMKAEGIDNVVLMGHSTGGLITAAYARDYIRRFAESRGKLPVITSLVLNSPFLDWNMNQFMRSAAIPAVDLIGGFFPKIEISNGKSTAYGESLHRDYHGEWNFNTEWKTIFPEKVTAAWVRAIDDGHQIVQHNPTIVIPILLLRSDRSTYGPDYWTEENEHGDAVLDVSLISKYGRRLGCEVTEVVIPGGLHDLALSQKPQRQAFYEAIFRFLER